MSQCVLVVEDDDAIAFPLVRTLEREGYTVVHRSQGSQAVQRALEGDIDLMILDLGLPDLDGLEVCRRARAAGYDNPVLILTARDGELDMVVGLDVGADDYMAKPFGLAELLARVRALLRRARISPPPARNGHRYLDRRDDALRIDVDARRVWVRGREVLLTSKEFDVLALLDEQPGTVVTRDRLMEQVWDTNWFGSTKTLDVTIGRLRQKLEFHRSPTRVVTVRGVGFRLEDVDESGEDRAADG